MTIYRRDSKRYININPIQRGGILTEDALKTLIEFADGYSICDYCVKGRLHIIDKPPIKSFHEEVAKWLNMDEVRTTPGNRIGQKMVFKALAKKDAFVVLDSNAHYTSYLAIESAGMNVKEVPHTGYPEFKVEEDLFAYKIEEVKKETGELPVAVFGTHVDSYYGNLLDIRKIGKIAKEYDVPFILNCAYTMGIMPLDGKEIGADFLIGSGHKSMAASAPIGILATTDYWKDVVFKKSKIQGDWSGRAFPEKEIEEAGCPVGGAPLMTLMASFPTVQERVKYFDEEVRKANYFVDKIELIGRDTMQLGEKPKHHTLIHFEIPDFYWVSLKHKQRGFFVYKSLKKHGIFGVQLGRSKDFKVNTYSLSENELEQVIGAFFSIAKENDIPVYE